ncbi:HAD family hydrolase [Hafnia alvei]|uniref:HAD family hydrolase n=1 Tax=Hafnia alvei TaxID=569 RepID=UPI0034DD80B9
MPVKCKGFLFDLDGTLVDSLPVVETLVDKLGETSGRGPTRGSRFYPWQTGHHLAAAFYVW